MSDQREGEKMGEGKRLGKEWLEALLQLAEQDFRSLHTGDIKLVLGHIAAIEAELAEAREQMTHMQPLEPGRLQLELTAASASEYIVDDGRKARAALAEEGKG